MPIDIEGIAAFLIYFIQIFIEIATFMIFARVVLSWIPTKPNALTEFIRTATEPILLLAKKITPRLGMIDLSPIIALFGMNILGGILITLIQKAVTLI